MASPLFLSNGVSRAFIYFPDSPDSQDFLDLLQRLREIINQIALVF